MKLFHRTARYKTTVNNIHRASNNDKLQDRVLFRLTSRYDKAATMVRMKLEQNIGPGTDVYRMNELRETKAHQSMKNNR